MSELFHIVDPSISKCGIILIEKIPGTLKVIP